MVTTRADGIAILVDPSEHRTAPVESLNFGNDEASDSSIIRSLAPHMDIMLDIGASIDRYSLLVSSISPGASFHVFEPIPVTFEHLTENCSLNRPNSIKCHNFGCPLIPALFRSIFIQRVQGMRQFEFWQT